MTTRVMFKWTDECIEMLEKLWATDLSAGEIAAEMGGFQHLDDGGRCAILGKAHRLNLPSRIKGHAQRSFGYGRTDIEARRANAVPKPPKREPRRPSIISDKYGNISFIRRPGDMISFKAPSVRAGTSKTSPAYRNMIGTAHEMTVNQRRDFLAQAIRNTAALPIVETSA